MGPPTQRRPISQGGHSCPCSLMAGQRGLSSAPVAQAPKFLTPSRGLFLGRSQSQCSVLSPADPVMLEEEEGGSQGTDILSGSHVSLPVMFPLVSLGFPMLVCQVQADRPR